MNPLILALGSVAISVGAQFALKIGVSSPAVQAALLQPGLLLRSSLSVLTNPFIFLGLIMYALGAVVWLGVLAKWDVSKAYPLVGLGFVLAAIVGALCGEQVTVSRIIGVTLISAGAFFVART